MKNDLYRDGSTHPTPANFALQFDGEDDYVETPIQYEDGNPPFTVEAYVIPGSVGGREYAAVSSGQFWVRHHPHPYEPYGGRPVWAADGATADGSGSHGVSTKSAVTPGERVHLAAVWDQKDLTLFVDGVRQGARSLEGGLKGKGYRFKIGAVPEGYGKEIHGHFDGIIDEVRFSKVARYAEDFTPAKRFEPDEQTIALYHFDEAEGDVLKDSSGNGHDGKIVGATWVKEVAPGEFVPFDPDRLVAEWILTKGGTVGLLLGKDDHDVVQVRPIEELPRVSFLLRRIQIANVENASGPTISIGPEDIEHIQRLGHLWSLRLQGTNVTDDNLSRLAEVESVEELHLGNTKVSAEGLAYLARLPVLRNLYLPGTSIGDEAIEVIKAIETLRRLNLEKTKITAKGIAEIATALPDCDITWDGNIDRDRQAAEWVLGIGGNVKCRIGEKDIDVRTSDDLPDQPFSVVALDLLNNRSFDDADLEHLAQLQRLYTVQLTGTRITDEGLKTLAEIDSLWGIIVWGTRISDVGLEHLTRLPKLEQVNAGNTQITDAGLAHLGKMSHLFFVDISYTKVTDAGLMHLTALDRLSKLWLSGTQVTDAGLKQLEGFANLAELHLDKTKVTPNGVAKLLAALPNCKIIHESVSSSVDADRRAADP